MPKRILQGTVVSDGNDKTVVVNVDRRVRHPLYKKTITRSSKFHAHDESNSYKIGDKQSEKDYKEKASKLEKDKTLQNLEKKIVEIEKK